MERFEKAVFTNMCMVYDNDKILVQDRVDPTWHGLTFPGGHVETNESFVESTIREVYEETGLRISNLRLCGVKQWTSKDNSYRYVVLLYKTNTFSGKIVSSREGNIFWIDRKDIDKYQLVDDFKLALEVFDNDKFSEEYYWFENGEWKESNK